MLRTTIAIIAGFILWSVLWLGGNSLLRLLFPAALREDGQVSSSGLLILLLGLAVVASVGAGYIAMLIAQATVIRSALILGLVLLLVGIGVQSQYWSVLPLWYHVSFLVLLLPATLLGGWLRLQS